jgi:O-antigen/teichoic acid export membrane protein
MSCILTCLMTGSSHLDYILLSFLISSAIPSFFAIWTGWSWIGSIRMACKKQMKELFSFGKYSMGTLMTSNLLRSSDTFIIGFMLTAKDVAAYSIPLKLIEILEIPLRSFLATAMPTMSKFKEEDKRKELRAAFYKYAGFMSILILPVSAGCILFADSLVILLGGHQYAESANILSILAVYTAFLPLDRFSGVTLDIIGKPFMNLVKVLLMLTVNIAGDLLAIHYAGTISAVAAVSIITFLSGLLFGNYILNWHLNHSVKVTLQTGIIQAGNLIKPILIKLKNLHPGYNNNI